MIIKSAQPTNGAEQPQIPPEDYGNSHLDRFQRIDILARVEGFLPTCLAEQTEVMGLQSEIGRLGGAARHLAEVVRHQNKSRTSDPRAAARKITRNYIDYALDAKTRGLELISLTDDLQEVNPGLTMDQVVTPTQPGVLAFMRFFDLSSLGYGVRIEKIGYDPQKVTYKPENDEIVAHAEMALESWRVRQVSQRLPEARQDQALRMAFFAARLAELKKHFPHLNPIASEGLDQIYDRAQAS